MTFTQSHTGGAVRGRRYQVVWVVLVPTVLRVVDVNVVIQVACGKRSTSSWACATTGTGTGLCVTVDG